MKIGLDAIDASGIQNKFAEILAEQSIHLGPIALRTAKTYQRYTEMAAAKIMNIQIKSSNWGPMKGHVPLESVFGRIDENDLLLPPKDNPNNTQYYVVQEQTTLRDIFSYPKAHYTLTRYDQETGQLFFSALSPHNREFMGQFMINLSEGVCNVVSQQERFTRRMDIPDPLHDAQILQLIHQCIPNWQSSRYGAFNEILNKYYPLYSTTTTVATDMPSPVWIYANIKKRPFTCDWDMLWVGLPYQVLPTVLIPLAQTPINTQLPGAMQQLNEALEMLIKTLLEKSIALSLVDCLIHAERPTEDIGIIAPWEYLHMLLGNTRYHDPYMNHLLQHGPENRTPYQPQRFDGPTLHFIAGTIVLPENEVELLQLIHGEASFKAVCDGFLDAYFLHIHPKWTEAKHSPYAEAWAQARMQQMERCQKQGIELPDTLSYSTTLTYLSQQSPKPLERFRIPKNADFEQLYHPRHPVCNTLTPEQQDNLRRMLTATQAKRIPNKS